jgi:hypothetical protein
MFLATSRHNRHQNWDMSYRGTSFCIPLVEEDCCQTTSHTICDIASALWWFHAVWNEKCVLSSDMVNVRFSRIFSFTWSSRSAVTKDGWPLRSSSWTFVLPSLNILHHLLTIQYFSINFTNLPINFSRANIFGIQKFDHLSYLTTGRTFNSHIHFKTKWQTYK